MDSGASHDLMPKIVMEKLGLQITRPSHDLYSFDARKVTCLGMIKDLVVVAVKSVLMDIVVADVPVNYGMLLSRSWASKLGGSLQMDMAYATIPVFYGETNRLYRETKLTYTISDPNHPNNYLVYSKDQYLCCFILSANSERGLCTKIVNTLCCFILSVNSERGLCTEIVNTLLCENRDPEEGMWKMYFNGASS